jgi:hypothetical protein
VRSGAGAPAAGLGVVGDFYIDTTAEAIYGPKTAGGWGAATSLIGPPGPADRGAWHDLPLTPTWTPSGGQGAPPPRYRMDAMGIVHLDGMATNQGGGFSFVNATSDIGTLPAGFRPTTPQFRVTYAYDAGSAINTIILVIVGTDGRIFLRSAGAAISGTTNSQAFLGDIEFEAAIVPVPR